MKKKKLGILFGAVLCACSLAPACADQPKREEETGLEYLTLTGAHACPLAAGASETLTLDVSVGDRNYFVLDAASDVPVLGKLLYAGEDGEETCEEDFFLPAGTDGEFRQLLDYYQVHLFQKRIRAVSFQNVGTAAGTLRVREAKLALRDVDELYERPEVTLSSPDVRLTVGLKSGGAVHGLEYLREPVQQVRNADGEMLVGVNYAGLPGVTVMYPEGVNLLNRFDHGRLVQQSYYGTSRPPYVCEQYMGWTWPYNPVQGGNWTGVSSRIVDYEVTEERIYVKCRPLDWAKGDKSGSYSVTPAYMENVYTVSGSTVRVENRFTDFSGYTHVRRDQELPAFYGVIALGTLVTYRGDKPFQGEPASYYPELGSWMAEETRAKWTDLTEHWMAWVNDDGFGVGVYTPDDPDILAGKLGTKYLEGKLEKSESTVYTAMIEQIELKTYEPFSYNYFLSAGQVDEMRESFNELAKTETNPDIRKWNG